MKRNAMALLMTFVVSCTIPLVLGRWFNGVWPEWRGVLYVLAMASVTVLLPLLLVAAPILQWCRRRGLRQTLGTVVIAALLTAVPGLAVFAWLWTMPYQDASRNVLRALTAPEAPLMYLLFGIPGALYGYLSRDRTGANSGAEPI